MATRAFDDTRPPELDLIQDCVHCGFCLPTCPTYSLWGEEMDSPRGRIVLMKDGLQEGTDLSAPMVQHIDNCLGCMACVTACPSGVQYDKLIEDTRAQVERNHERPPQERAFRRLVFELFPHPARLRLAAPGLAAARALGLDKIARRPRVRKLAPRLASLAALSPQTPLRRALARLPERYEAKGETRGRVALLQGCVQRVFFSDVNEATAQVLAAEGCDVHLAALAALLRRPAAPLGRGLARPRARHHRELRGLRPRGRERRRLRLGDEGLRPPLPRRPRVGGPRRALRGAGVRRHGAARRGRAAGGAPAGADEGRLPRRVPPGARPGRALAAARAPARDPRLELVEPAEWEICCGSAGVYNLLQPEPAAELGERKARNLLDTGAEAIAAANPGCALQIAAHSERLGRRLDVLHPMELLARSIGVDGR